MATVPFHYVDLRAFAYATTEEKRVADALRTFLPEDTTVGTSSRTSATTATGSSCSRPGSRMQTECATSSIDSPSSTRLIA